MPGPIIGTGKLIILGCAAVLAACAGKPSGNGMWAAELIDGRKVSGEYYILVANERITSGKDGCNAWAYTDDSSIDSTAIGCPPDTERDRKAYWAVVRAAGDLPHPSGNRLVLKGGSHTASFRGVPEP